MYNIYQTKLKMHLGKNNTSSDFYVGSLRVKVTNEVTYICFLPWIKDLPIWLRMQVELLANI